MLSGQLQCSILSQNHTFNSLNFKRTLLASGSHKYLISLHLSMLNSSTDPRYSIIPFHTTSLSPEIDSISNLVTDEAT
ncbi:hypothetical protein Hanom_Chr04g00296651 [Helianthus anomalus]